MCRISSWHKKFSFFTYATYFSCTFYLYLSCEGPSLATVYFIPFFFITSHHSVCLLAVLDLTQICLPMSFHLWNFSSSIYQHDSFIHACTYIYIGEGIRLLVGSDSSSNSEMIVRERRKISLCFVHIACVHFWWTYIHSSRIINDVYRLAVVALTYLLF